jgi:hypothetical protein
MEMVTGSGSELNLVARAWSQRLQVSLGPTRARQHRAERVGPDIYTPPAFWDCGSIFQASLAGCLAT